MTQTTRLFLVITTFAAIGLLNAAPSQAKGFSGAYTHPDRTSLRIVERGGTVHLTFYAANKTVSARGVGLVISGKLYFYFKRTARTGKRGGSGVYVLKGRRIDAKHFHLNGKVRWKGVWRKK